VCRTPAHKDFHYYQGYGSWVHKEILFKNALMVRSALEKEIHQIRDSTSEIGDATLYIYRCSYPVNPVKLFKSSKKTVLKSQIIKKPTLVNIKKPAT
jgi:hypothetical protein